MNKRGCITFVFDDGYDDVYRSVVPLLEKYKLRGVFAIPLESTKLAQETRLTIHPWSEWLSVRKKDHEIAAHSVSHTDLTTLTEPELLRELQEPAQILQATTLVYPGGAHNDNIVEVTKQYYKAARTVLKGFNSIPAHDNYRLKTYNFTKTNFSVFKANALAVWAYITDSWLIETYHVVSPTASPLLHSTLLADFEKHLRFIKKIPLANKTIRDITNPL